MKVLKDTKAALKKALKSGLPHEHLVEYVRFLENDLPRIGDPVGPTEHALRVVTAAGGEGWTDADWATFVGALRGLKAGLVTREQILKETSRWQAGKTIDGPSAAR